MTDRCPPSPTSEPQRPRSLADQYLDHLPLLVVALAGYLAVWLLIGNVEPAAVADWLWADSYLPIQLLLAVSNFCLATFVTGRRAVGEWAASSVAVVLFFRLGHFVLTWPLTLSLLAGSAIWWWWLVARGGRSPATPVPT